MLKKEETSLLKMILIRLCVVLFLLSISRWFLYIFNTNKFNNIELSELVKLYFVGFRFDIHTLIIFNAPLLILYTIPLRIKYNVIYKKTTDIIFIVTNSLAIGLNLIDVIYYRYLDKRMSSELFTFLSGGDENQGSLMMNFIIDFWFMFLIFFTLLFFIIILTRKTKLKDEFQANDRLWYVKQTLIFIITLGISVVGIRGGIQLKPINLLTATEYTSAENTPLVINTPFSIIMSSTSSELEKINYFDEEIIERMYSPIHNNLSHNRFIKSNAENYNIVVIIIESFGQEMIGFYNSEYAESLTPFLDSLFKESLTFDGMANGRRSIEALPSIFCGLPSLMPTDYPSSRYAINRLYGFGNVLKEKGYETAFFHGGNNGTMSFNTTSRSSGFDKYYGRDEYNNDSDFDGTWGIYDEPFLQFTAEKLNEFNKPFAAAIFTLSSHHPYSLPDDYIAKEATNKEHLSPFEKTVKYADYALGEFFNAISQYEWFDKTLFVITADHVNPEHKFNNYKNARGNFQIPLAFYSPQIIENKHINEIAQHIDIGVSLLSALNINESTFSFGRNIFDSLQRQSHISFLNNIYQYSDGRYLMKSDGKNITAVHELKKDNNIGKNIYKNNDDSWNELETEFKLRLQQYNNRMINNKLYK